MGVIASIRTLMDRPTPNPSGMALKVHAVMQRSREKEVAKKFKMTESSAR